MVADSPSAFDRVVVAAAVGGGGFCSCPPSRLHSTRRGDHPKSPKLPKSARGSANSDDGQSKLVETLEPCQALSCPPPLPALSSLHTRRHSSSPRARLSSPSTIHIRTYLCLYEYIQRSLSASLPHHDHSQPAQMTLRLNRLGCRRPTSYSPNPSLFVGLHSPVWHQQPGRLRSRLCHVCFSATARLHVLTSVNGMRSCMNF